jgi:precorrin-6B methylase 2
MHTQQDDEEQGYKCTGTILSKRKIRTQMGIICLLSNDDRDDDDQFFINNRPLIRSVKVGDVIEVKYNIILSESIPMNIKKRVVSIEKLSSSTQQVIPDNGYSYMIYPPTEQPIYSIDEVVWILKDKKLFSKARIIQPIDTDPNSSFNGRYTISYLNDGSIYHVRPKSVCRIEQDKKVIVCESTLVYRKLAGLQTCSQDVALEIGSALGHATHYLSQYCGKVIGIDKSREFVQTAQTNYPDIEFICMDVIQEKEALINLLTKHHVNKVFIDINGNRMLKTVLLVIDLIQQIIQPSLIVVKSEEAFSFLKHQHEENNN